MANDVTDPELLKKSSEYVEKYVREKLMTGNVSVLLRNVRDNVNAVVASLPLTKGQIMLIMMDGQLATAEQDIQTLRTLFQDTKKISDVLQKKFIAREQQKSR